MKKIILSDNKQNQLVDEITDALMQRHEFTNGFIRGEAISEFCPHQQVNNFIMFRISQEWIAHTQRLSHPYFNFSHPNVKEATRRFANSVSKHIQVNEADFRKLVRHAVYNNLKLILNPQETILNFFFSSAQSIPVEIYRKYALYFNDFDFGIKSIQRYLEKNEIRAVERSLFLEKFSKVLVIFEKKEGKSIGEYQRYLFRRLTGKEMEEVVGNNAPAPVGVSDAQKEAEAKAAAEEARKKEEAAAAKLAEQKKAGEAQKAEAERKAAERLETERKAAAEKKAEEERKAEEARKAEAERKAEEERKKRPTIKVTPSARKEPDPLPPREEAKSSLPPWIDQEKMKRKKAAEEAAKTPPKPKLKPAPESTVPPWVEKPKGRPVVESPVSKPAAKTETPPVEKPAVSDLPKSEVPKAEKPVAKTPPPVVPTAKPTEDKPRTVSDFLKDKADEKPRSLNDMFANRANEGKSILEASRENVEDRVSSNLGRHTEPETPPVVPKREPVIETPVAREEPVKPEPVEESKPREVEVSTEEPPKVEAPEQVRRLTVVEENEADSGEEPKTLAESFLERQEEKPASVADQLSSKAIKAEQIPVHKQFQYVQRVFGGSSVKFKVVLDKINKTKSLEEAEAVMNKYVFNDPNINRNDKVAKEFELLVRNRFEE